MTGELIPFRKFECKRGNKVDDVLLPDATVFFPTPVHFEMDMDTEGYDQVARQIERYGDQYNVWITTKQSRLEGLMKLAGPSSMFTVCGSKLWIDSQGHEISVEKVLSLFARRSK